MVVRYAVLLLILNLCAPLCEFGRVQKDSTFFKWTHSVWLGEKWTSPRLYWKAQDEFVEFQIEANTIGSIHLKFNDEDFIVLWVDDITGKAIIEDYHYINTTTPILDEANDYDVIGADQNITHSVVAFKRLMNTCDDNDAVFGSDTLKINWSIHPHDGNEVDLSELILQDDLILDNAVQGRRSILLELPVQTQYPRSLNAHRWDVLMKNVVITADVTTHYWCKLFRSPSLPKRNHIVGYEPLILTNATSLVHHMVLYECDAPNGYLDKYSFHNGAPCYSKHIPEDWDSCVTPVATWVMGGHAKILPEHVGLPIGPRQMYFMLEVHYDNPERRKVIDNSGFRLFHTEELRQYDAGVMRTGSLVSPVHFIPPLQVDYHSTGLCNDICTNTVFPEMGIKVISVLFHSHTAVKAMRLRHIRGDKEMPRIVEDNNYDFNFQTDRDLQDEITVFPGDQLVTECEYSTLDRAHPTFGGHSTKEEVCLAFITYYPQTSLSSCHSMTPVSYFFKALGIKAFHGISMKDIQQYILRLEPSPTFHKVTKNRLASVDRTDDPRASENMAGVNMEDNADYNKLLQLVISEPQEFRNKTLGNHIMALPWWDATFSGSFEISLSRGLEVVFCRRRNDKLAVPLNIESFPNFTELDIKEIKHCSSSSFVERHLSSSSSRGPDKQFCIISVALISLSQLYTLILMLYS